MSGTYQKVNSIPGRRTGIHAVLHHTKESTNSMNMRKQMTDERERNILWFGFYKTRISDWNRSN